MSKNILKIDGKIKYPEIEKEEICCGKYSEVYRVSIYTNVREHSKFMKVSSVRFIEKFSAIIVSLTYC